MNISDCKILQPLARNASGKSYLALQPNSDRVVIKFLNKKSLPRSSRDSIEESFLERGQTISNISHPHIARVHAVGQTKNVLYTITDYIEGESLESLAGHSCILDQIYIIKQIAEAIDYLAKNRQNHLNIRPSSIILSANSSQPILVGFGCAQVMQLNFSAAKEELFLSPPRHTNPENLNNISLGVCSDLYSLSIIFYTLLTNINPMQMAPSLAAGSQNFVPLIPKSLPTNLKIFQPFFNQAMAVEPGHRFRSGRELVAALDSINDEEIAYIKNQQAMSLSSQDTSTAEKSNTQSSNNVILLKTAQTKPKEASQPPPEISEKPEAKEPEKQINIEQGTLSASNEQQLQSNSKPTIKKRGAKRSLFLFFIFLVVTGLFLTQQNENYWSTLSNQISQLFESIFNF